MIENLRIVVATPFTEEEFKTKSKLYPSLKRLGLHEDLIMITDNKTGLPSVYNRFIDEENRDTYMVFIHDDVIIEDLYFTGKLKKAFEQYDIVGLAGAKQCDVAHPVSAWHIMSDRSSHVGEVAHPNGDLIHTSVFGPTPSRALIIDGLFMAAKVSRLLDTNTKFDEDFDFHHYDISFCLRANKNGLKIGVYPIRVLHFGMGEFNNPEWRKSAETFKKKYSQLK